MTDQILPPQAASIPVISAANRVAVTLQPTDLTLSLGIARLAFDPLGNQVGTRVEYLQSFSLSPTTAKQLSEILRITLSKYEDSWGKIPMDKGTVEHLQLLESKPIKEWSIEPTQVKKPRAKRAVKTARVKARP